jgi:hypothetical protein
MKSNFSKISYLSYQEDECSDLSVQTWKFLYIWVCILLQTSVSWSYRFYFSTFNEITRANSQNNIFLFPPYTVY